MMRTRRDGFTLVELMTVVLVVGILVRIGVPQYRAMMLKARAAEALSNIQAVRVAAYAYNTDMHRWPPDYAPGELPPELAPYLGAEFPFEGRGYELDWENWVLPDGTPKHPETGVLLGISITTTEPGLGEALVGLLGQGTAKYTLGDNYTYILSAL